MRQEMNISREEFDEILERQAAREAQTPAVGTVAPAFRHRRLDQKGKRTDYFLELAALRGRPLGLVFGSYT